MPTMASSSGEPVILARALGKAYNGRWVVRGLDFEIARGRFVGLLGTNGAGKTTTIAMILGLLVPSAGEVRVFGHPMPRGRHAVLHRMNFSSPYVDLPARLTVRQNLDVYARLYGVRDVAGRIRTLADELDLKEVMDRPTGRLSAGQKSRLALAKALVNDPELLVLDEPTASLDPDTADRVRTHLASWARRTGATVFMASHNMREVERLCDEVLIMDAGRIVERGAPARLVRRHGVADLEELFLKLVRGGRADRAAG